MRVYYNSRDEYCKMPFGAVECGTKVSFRMKVYEPIKSLKVYLSMWKDAEKIPDIELEKENFDDHVEFFITYKMPSEATLIWYHFRLSNMDEKYYYCNNERQTGGEGRLIEYNPLSYQQTVYKKDKSIKSNKAGIVYQIFPDRFNRGSDYEKRKENTLKRIEGKNHGKRFVDDWYMTPRYNRRNDMSIIDYDFYGGTLKGIEEKLPYLSELGVTYIYLNPIFEARSNHRYDTGDYMKIDSLLGDEKSLQELINTAKDYDIKIILDGVFSHQGADSKYFNKFSNYDNVGACNSMESPYYEWYNFIKYPDIYESWWGIDDLPNVKEMTGSYIDYICKNHDSVINHYMKKGLGGFRLDVADELPDEFIKEIRNTIEKNNKNAILIGEVWEDATNKVSYEVKRKYFINTSLNSVTNYPFMNNAIAFMKGYMSPSDLYEFFYSQKENYPSIYFNQIINLVDSHDRVRIITTLSDSPDVGSLSDDEKYNYNINNDKYMLAISRLKALSVLQYTVPGMPLLYYGDEAGVYGYDDPYNRKTYPWDREDKNLIEHYKALGKVRNEEIVFLKGDFTPMIKTKNVFGFKRQYKNDIIYVLINRGIFHEEGEHIDIIEDGISYGVDIDSLGYKIIKYKNGKYQNIM